MRDFASYLIAYAAAVGVVAIITTIVVEGLKLFFPIRAMFHKHELLSWCAETGRLHYFRPLDSGLPAPMVNLFSLLSGRGSLTAVLEQSTPRLMALTQTIASNVLSNPDLAPALFDFLSESEETTTPPRPDAAMHNENAARWRVFVAHGVPDSPEALRIRDDFERLVERKLDALQARLEYRWARMNRYVTFAVALYLVIAVAALYDTGSLGTIRSSFISILAALVAVVVQELVRTAITERISGER